MVCRVGNRARVIARVEVCLWEGMGGRRRRLCSVSPKRPVCGGWGCCVRLCDAAERFL